MGRALPFWPLLVASTLGSIDAVCPARVATVVENVTVGCASALATAACAPGETKTSAEPNAQSKPTLLDAEVSKLQTSMTPKVSGSRERYVCGL